jgi:hypothetical protein
VTLPAAAVEPAASAQTLARDASQDIWTHASDYIQQRREKSSFFPRRPWCAAWPPGYTELCERIA